MAIGFMSLLTTSWLMRLPHRAVYLLSTGLILAADSCAEIAGVMGHELAHVTQKHGQKARKYHGCSDGGEIVLGDGAGQQTASAIWAFFQNTTFSREDETEADLVGLQITKEGGYDPDWRTFFRSS